MSISAELVARYSTEVDQDWWEGLVLSHSLAGALYLCNAEAPQIGEVDGIAHTFQAVPFRLTLPARSADGRQDLRVELCAIGGEAQAHVNTALGDPTEGILLRYGQWLRGDPTQQWVPLLPLTLTEVVITDTAAAAQASSADLLNRPFPSVLYTRDLFPGLDR